MEKKHRAILYFNVKYLVMNIVVVDRNRQNNIANKL